MAPASEPSTVTVRHALDGGRIRLLWALASTAATPLAAGGALFVLQVACSLATPVVINLLLAWVSQPAPDPAVGAGYVVALAAASVVGFAAEHGVETAAKKHAGAASRTAAAGLVFEKVLRTSIVDAQRTHSGELTSLFASDAAALGALWHGLIVMILQPLEIGGIIALLALYVQFAALGGLAVVLAAIVILQAAGARLEALFAARASLTDGRVRDVLEMLLGMRVVKLNALEPRFTAAISAARAAESALSRQSRWWYAAINTTSSNSVDVISLGVLLVYTLGQGRPLNAEVVFTYWVLLSLLHGRIFSYPVALKHVRDGLTAVRRIDDFLRRPERVDTRLLLPPAPAAPVATDDGGSNAIGVLVQRGYFSWTLRAAQTQAQPDAPSSALPDATAAAAAAAATASAADAAHAAMLRSACLLQGVHMSLPRGQLGCIVGSVGSGKSSLLAALLGEMDPVAQPSPTPAAAISGSDGGGFDPVAAVAAAAGLTREQAAAAQVVLATSGTPVGYVPQAAFIIAGTVRDNIVFGRPWDPVRYAAVTEACALLPDFGSWPLGDATHVSTFTASGGQRQRISIARAAYGVCGLYLFDDCLSALDARVGRHVLSKCLTGLLAGSTRVIVTSSASVLRHAQWVGVTVPLRALRLAAAQAGLPLRQPDGVARFEDADAAASRLPPSLRRVYAREPGLFAALTDSLSSQPTISADEQPADSGSSAVASDSGSSAVASAAASVSAGAASSSNSKKGEAGPFTLLWGARDDMGADAFVAPLLTSLAGRTAGGGGGDDSQVPPPTRPQDGAPSSAAADSGSEAAPPHYRPHQHPPDSPAALAAATAAAVAASHATGPAGLGVGPTPREHAPFFTTEPTVPHLVSPQHGPEAASATSFDMPMPPTAPTGALVTSATPTAESAAGADGGHLEAEAPLPPPPPAARRHRTALPFLTNWVLGAGGLRYVVPVMALLALEAAFVEVGVYWLAWWSEDPGFTRVSFATYQWVYAIMVALELLSAYLRQHVYITGITTACDDLHGAVLARLARAPQWYFDTHSAGSLLDLLGRDLSALDGGTFYASEYFWLGITYGALIIAVEIVITPWVLLPAALSLALLWLVIVRERGSSDDDEDEGEGADDNVEDAGGASGAGKAVTLALPPAAAGSPSAAAGTDSSVAVVPAAAPSGGDAANAAPLVGADSSISGTAVTSKKKPRGRPSVSALMTAEAAAAVPVLEHFTQALEGLPVLRAFDAQGRFLTRHHQLADTHNAAHAAVGAAEAATVLLGNLCGACYYILSVAIIVPLRVAAGASTSTGGALSAGDAGFIIVNSAFSSYMATMVLQQRAALADLAFTRGSLVRAVMEMPVVEGDVGGTPQEEAALAAAEARYRRPYEAMMARERRREARAGAAAARRQLPPHRRAWAGVRALFARPPTAAAAQSAPPPPLPPTAVKATGGSVPPPAGWPSAGRVTISGLQMRYRPHLPLVLRGVDLDIAPGEVVCVVGRTGAGKSSLVAALTRLVEPAAGSIAIDGVDAGCLPLRALRSGLTVVSQDPLFFTGTLRRNLDPFGEHTDDELLAALRRVRLLEFAAAQARAASARLPPAAAAASAATAEAAAPAADGAAEPTVPPSLPPSRRRLASSRSLARRLLLLGGGGEPAPSGAATAPPAPVNPLDMPVSERGGNLSAGQQQLLALARALLRRPRVLLLDEATASLDVETEALVNDTLLASFAGCTVVQIAHRLVGAVGAHRVVVMAEGRVAEVGSPWTLLSRGPGSVGLFADMAAALPPAQRARLEAAAKAAHDRRAGGTAA